MKLQLTWEGAKMELEQAKGFLIKIWRSPCS